MSADERRVRDFLDAARRRARLLLLAEGVCWTALLTAAIIVIALAAHWRVTVAVVTAALAAVAPIGWIAVARRRTSPTALMNRVERTHPASRNVLFTAAELLSAEPNRTVVRPWIRDRVVADAAAVADDVKLATALPATRVWRIGVLAVGVLVAVSVAVWAHTAPADRSAAGGGNATLTPGSMRVSVRVAPPAYTQVAAQTFVNPSQIEAPEGSVATVSIDTPAVRVTIDRDGVSKVLERDAAGRLVDQITLASTGYLAIDAGGAGRRWVVPVVVRPDALPTVALDAPGRDLVYAGERPRIAFGARATDDYGLQSLSLSYTTVSGSGEQFAFREGRIPLSVSRDTERRWRGEASRSLADFNLKDGDMLVYHAEASDWRPGGGQASSDAFFIAISTRAPDAAEGFTLPEEETRYALSQQMLIVQTERLGQRRASMPGREFAEAALNLAAQQRSIRAEFVFMLGGEVEDEQVEAAQSSELQEGRLENGGRRDLQTATRAMSAAGTFLTAADTAQALGAERAAVAALQRAFARDRYLLRAPPSRARLDDSRRLTGDLSKAVDWRRRVPAAPSNRRAVLLQDLLKGIGEPMAARSGLSARALVLAEEALRIDAASPALRTAATQLQLAARAAQPGDRSRALDAAAAAVAAEIGRTIAGAPLQSADIAPGLQGAFVAALSDHPDGDR